MTKLSLTEIEKFIDEEPNYPGPMPIRLWFRTLWWLFTRPAHIFRYQVDVQKITLKRRLREKYDI